MDSSLQRYSFGTIQAGRGLAALLVLLFHAGPNIFANNKYWGFDPTYNIFAFGHAGVNFFFVLSGFIILHVHWQDIGQRGRVWDYAQKRFLRIYPIYWLILIVIVPIYYVLLSLGKGYERDPLLIASSITLIHFDTDRTILGVAWTLYHEVLFYIIFALAIWHRKIGFAFMSIWLLTSAAGLTISERTYPLAFFASPLHLLFAMGMGACWLIHKNRVKYPYILASIGIITFFSTGAAEVYDREWLSEDMRSLLYGIGSAMAIAGLATLEQQGHVRIRALPRLLGDASYSIYLTHYLLLSMLAKIFVFTGARNHIPPLLSLILIVATTVAIGILVHLAIERPLLTRIRQHLRLRSEARILRVATSNLK